MISKKADGKSLARSARTSDGAVRVAVGIQHWPYDLVEKVSAPASSDLLKRLANLEERVAKLETVKQ